MAEPPAKVQRTDRGGAAAERKFRFAVKGQEGEIPQIGFGTAVIPKPVVASAVQVALAAGYRHLDTALLYGNQEFVGEGLRKSGVPREEVWVTTKVGFFPRDCSGVWMHNPLNEKGGETASLALSLEQLGLSYVDLCLIHCPCTGREEYNASCLPHFFELKKAQGDEDAITPEFMADGTHLRTLIMEGKLQEARAVHSPSEAREKRRQSWALMERAKREGKCRYIGVSNMPAELLLEMKEYAEIMPAVNQLEIHPRYASPELRRVAKELGVVLCGYGFGNSVRIEETKASGEAIAAIAKRVGRSATQVVARWAVQSGVVPIVRSRTTEHIEENLRVFDFELSAEDMATLDGLDEDYPYYWSAKPLLPAPPPKL